MGAIGATQNAHLDLPDAGGFFRLQRLTSPCGLRWPFVLGARERSSAAPVNHIPGIQPHRLKPGFEYGINDAWKLGANVNDVGRRDPETRTGEVPRRIRRRISLALLRGFSCTPDGCHRGIARSFSRMGGGAAHVTRAVVVMAQWTILALLAPGSRRPPHIRRTKFRRSKSSTIWLERPELVLRVAQSGSIEHGLFAHFVFCLKAGFRHIRLVAGL